MYIVFFWDDGPINEAHCTKTKKRKKKQTNKFGDAPHLLIEVINMNPDRCPSSCESLCQK